MKGDETIEATDFVAFFDDLRLPLTLSDSVFKKKPNDTAQIELAVFKQFISDTIFKKEFGKEQPKLFAVGKFANEKEETYLLVRATTASQQQLYVAVIDKADKFKSAMPLISSKNKAGTESVLVDEKFLFTHATITTSAGGTSSTVSQVYAYNNAGLFMTILTDGLPAGTLLPIIDPIDTLPRKGKYAGNYAIDKRNLLSIRDAANAQVLKFFIHIEKSKNRPCDGELKGEAKMIGTDSAFYIGNGDPCEIGFRFIGNMIRISERNCGNKHGAECNFNGTFTRQKNPAKPVEKKKK